MEPIDLSSTKSLREIEIEQLVYFIRQSDVHNARRSIVNLLGRGQLISRDIVLEYQQLEAGLS